MDKRYQVFVSSTYADLKEERRHVIQTLMEMDCIPSGMELFPAADEEQFEFIKKVIDDCDYYILIIGGRYGSVTAEGVSYTEKEYDYAIEKRIPVLAFIHAKPENIPAGKSEMNPEARGRLDAFRIKASANRLVKPWERADELPGLVALSLSKTMKTHPAVGWIRASQASNPELLNDLNELRKENSVVKAELLSLKKSDALEIPDIASIDEEITLSGSYRAYGSIKWESWTSSMTWRSLFSILAPELVEIPSDATLKKRLEGTFIHGSASTTLIQYRSLSAYSFHTIRVQFQALGLIDVKYLSTTDGGKALFWSLTDSGTALMFSLRTVKTKI